MALPQPTPGALALLVAALSVALLAVLAMVAAEVLDRGFDEAGHYSGGGFDRGLQLLTANASGGKVRPHFPTVPWRPLWPREGAEGGCSRRFVAGPPPGVATELNGVVLPDVCFPEDVPHHVYVLGVWGGVRTGSGETVRPADSRAASAAGGSRPPLPVAAGSAQRSVARQMELRSQRHAPDYLISVGSNFWRGIQQRCGQSPGDVGDPTGQWEHLFEQMYTGRGLDGKQWLGCLGNRDFGGSSFTSGWDQTIGYTWSQVPTSTGRWMTPALYYSVVVRYSGFSVDYFFVDTNYFDAFHPDMHEDHNLCSRSHNDVAATCGPEGPTSVNDCPRWFGALWRSQLAWLEGGLRNSSADWQVVVAHSSIENVLDTWQRLSQEYGIDLVLTGRRHWQEVHYVDALNPLRPTAVVVAGGGGGVPSEEVFPVDGVDDRYGFIDLQFSKGEIRIDAVSDGGQVRSTTCVRPRPRQGGLPPVVLLPGASLCSDASLAPLPSSHGFGGVDLSEMFATRLGAAPRTVVGGGSGLDGAIFGPPPPELEASLGAIAVGGARVSTAFRPTDEASAALTETSTSNSPFEVNTFSRRCKLLVFMQVRNVDYALLSGASAYRDRFAAAVKRALALVAGSWVEPQHVELDLGPGPERYSVAVRAFIDQSGLVSAEWVEATLSQSISVLEHTVAIYVTDADGARKTPLPGVVVDDVLVYLGEGSPESPCEGPLDVVAEDEVAAVSAAGRPLAAALLHAPRPPADVALWAVVLCWTAALSVPYILWRSRSGVVCPSDDRFDGRALNSDGASEGGEACDFGCEDDAVTEPLLSHL